MGIPLGFLCSVTLPPIVLIFSYKSRKFVLAHLRQPLYNGLEWFDAKVASLQVATTPWC